MTDDFWQGILEQRESNESDVWEEVKKKRNEPLPITVAAPNVDLSADLSLPPGAPPPKLAPVLPFMAVGQTAEGENVFDNSDPDAPFLQRIIQGSGLSAYLRKTWGNIFDPLKIGEGLSSDQQKMAEEIQPFIERYYNEIPILKDVVEPLTGITTQEMAESVAPVAAETDFGDQLQTLFGVTKRAIGTGVSFGLGLFSGVSQIGRTVRGIDQSIDRMIGAETPGDLNAGEILFHEKFAHAHKVDVVSRIVKGFSSGELTTKDFGDAIVRGLYASRAVYSLYGDEALRGEFYRRYQAGENPELLIKEAQAKHPWMEAGGDVLLDPTTYFGLGMAKYVGKGAQGARYLRFIGMEQKWLGKQWKTLFYIPEFGEMIKLEVAGGRLLKEGADILRPSQEFLPYIDEMGKVANEREAAVVAKNFILETRKAMAAEKSPQKAYRAFAGTSLTKSKVMLRDTGQVIEGIAAMPNTGKEKLGILRAMIDLGRGNEVERALAILSQTDAPGLFLSEQGKRTAVVLADMADSTVFQKIIENGVGKNTLSEIIVEVQRFADEFYPSIDEMADAAKVAKSARTEKQARLAEAYDGLSWYQKKARQLARIYEKPWGLGRAYMSTVFISASGKQPARNLLGQLIPMAIQLGPGEALRITGKALGGYLGDSFTRKILDKQTKTITDMLGVLPRRAEAGIGSEAGLEKAWGFAKISQRIEEITSGEIVIDGIRRVLQSAMESGAVPNIQDIQKAGLDQTQAELLARMFEDSWGDTNKAMKAYQDVGDHVDTWRFIKPSEEISSIFRMVDGMEEAAEEIRKTAMSPVDFANQMKKLINDSKDEADRLLREFHVEGSDLKLPEEMKRVLADADEAVKGGTLTGTERDAFENMTSAWYNVWMNAGEMDRRIVGELAVAINNTEIPTFAIMKKWSTARDEVATVRKMTRDAIDLIKKGGADYATIWESMKHGSSMGGEVTPLYDLARIFPDIDPMQLSRNEMIDHLWRGYFEGSGRIWYSSNTGYSNDLKVFWNKQAKLYGLPTPEGLVKIFDENDKLMDLAQQWEQKWALEKLARNGIGEIAGIAKKYDIAVTGRKMGTEVLLDKKIINIVNKYAGTEFKSLDEIEDMAVVEKAFADYQAAHAGVVKTGEEAAQAGKVIDDSPVPPYIQGTRASKARIYYESFDEFSKAVDGYVDRVAGEWGNTKPLKKLPKETIQAAMKAMQPAAEKMTQARIKAIRYSEGLRDFLLHDYNKTNIDVALAYLSPFHYWQTRTYMRGIEAALYSPQWVHWYNEYKEFLAAEHAGLPDFWKNNVTIGNLPGMKDHPLYFNLEASLNPYYNLLGTDFNDPRKRVDWASRMIDDASGTGYFSLPMVNWVLGYLLMAKNEDDAAQRTFGRLLPQSVALKALQAKTNIYLPETPLSRHGEVDPFVNFLMGGLDPYERGRVGRQAVGMDQNIAFDAAQMQEGEVWNQMVEKALDERASGQLLAEFFGVGFKYRRPEDIMVDEFYKELFNLTAMRDNMSSEQYRVSWNQLREKYPFADIVLLSKKTGSDRDQAIAFNVLSRIRPGEQTDLLALVGLTGQDVDKFYADKGDMSKWNPRDREAFNAGMGRLAAIIAIPKNATREEWEEARFLYSEMKSGIEKRLEITNPESFWETFYNVPSDYDERQKFFADNPKVEEAYDLRTQYLLANPLLNAYYGGMDTIERYYDGLVRQQMTDKYGEDIYDLQREYNNILDTKTKKKFKAQHSNLSAFLDDKTRAPLQDWVNREVAEIAKLMPKKKVTEIRPGQSSELTDLVKQITNSPERGVTSQQLWGEIQKNPQLAEMVKLYAQGMGDLSYTARQRLEYIGGFYGLNTADEVLQVLLAGQP